jgi:hypothetical protein
MKPCKTIEQLYNNKHITKRLDSAFNYRMYINVRIIVFIATVKGLIPIHLVFLFIFICTVVETFSFGLVLQIAYIFFNVFCNFLYPTGLYVSLLQM